MTCSGAAGRGKKEQAAPASDMIHKQHPFWFTFSLPFHAQLFISPFSVSRYKRDQEDHGTYTGDRWGAGRQSTMGRQGGGKKHAKSRGVYDSALGECCGGHPFFFFSRYTDIRSLLLFFTCFPPYFCRMYSAPEFCLSCTFTHTLMPAPAKQGIWFLACFIPPRLRPSPPSSPPSSSSSCVPFFSAFASFFGGL